MWKKASEGFPVNGHPESLENYFKTSTLIVRCISTKICLMIKEAYSDCAIDIRDIEYDLSEIEYLDESTPTETSAFEASGRIHAITIADTEQILLDVLIKPKMRITLFDKEVSSEELKEFFIKNKPIAESEEVMSPEEWVKTQYSIKELLHPEAYLMQQYSDYVSSLRLRGKTRLPEEKDSLHNMTIEEDMYDDGWNACIEETKRLNGI